MPNPTTVTLLCFALSAGLAAQGHLVVPQTAATADAMSYEWVAGASNQQRQQTLIGANHLTALVGHQIQAIEFRRNAVNEAFASGSADLVVTLSTVSRQPELCSNRFADNVGTNAVQVFSGTVTLPASPAVTGSTVAWTPANTIRIAFTQPFVYQGGTLCVDITGQPISGQRTWWMADAVEEVIPGTGATDLGDGCGSFGGPHRSWSYVAERSLVPGGYAIFRAEGTPNGIAIAMFGGKAQTPLPLGTFGVPTANCLSYLDPPAILGSVPTVFDPQTNASTSYSAVAEVLVHLPADPAWFGFRLTAQWFDLGELAVSNGVEWTVGSAVPTLGMALCEGTPQLPTGNVTTYLAHVMRFEYQ